MSRTRVLALIATVLAALAVAGCGGSDEATDTTTTEPTVTETTTQPTTQPTTTEPEPAGPTIVRIDVVNGAPEGGIVRETVTEGDRVVVVVRSDVADEIHLHGYDVSRPVRAGGTARLPFRATIPGRFEVELEERGVTIGDIAVRP